ncbi:MAG: type II secretion system protein M [Gammaproteobacteria bacterium]|nr:type II secretion system protein M [Gammaproteobacteria bacterium]MDX5375283.1 type II secretion system protein M [Gammaproteobacteria bacterium]
MRTWLEQLTPRDRRILIAGGAIALPLLFYVLAWAPLQRQITQLETSVAAQRASFSWMQSAAVEVARLRTRNANLAQAGGSLLSIVNQSAQRHELAKTIQRMTPQGEQAIELLISSVNFDGFVTWLGDLELEHSIMVSTLTLTRTELPCRVDVRLTLERR